MGRVLFWGPALAAVETALALAISQGSLQPAVPLASLRRDLLYGVSSASRNFGVLIRLYASNRNGLLALLPSTAFCFT